MKWSAHSQASPKPEDCHVESREVSKFKQAVISTQPKIFMNKLMYKIVLQLCKQVYPNIKVGILLGPYFKLLTKMIKTQGLVHTVKLLKGMRLHVTRVMCGQPLKTNNLMIGLNKETHWPKALDFLYPLFKGGSIEELKFLHTILILSRTLVPLKKKDKEKIKPDYLSIIKPGNMTKVIPSGFINKFVSDFNLKAKLPPFSLKDIYLSTKAGPGGPTSLTAQNSILSYSYNDIQNVWGLTDSNGVEFFSKQYGYMWTKAHQQIKSIGKLSFIYDPECKLRIVAIVDYYTQLFLKPIHDQLMNKLHNFSCDRTFTQNPTHCWEENDQSFWSLDLSSATDRFPISLQKRLLERIFSAELADRWHLTLSTRKFKTPEGGQLSYSVGQPMGAYSSWVAFTLCHHMLVHWCAHLCGISNFSQYIILGDDIVIKNDKVARMYIKWCNRLGIEISPHKTHVSKDTYEFAKRWFKGGREITGLPTRGIIWNIKNPFIVASVLYDYFKVKGNSWVCKDLVSVIASLYSGLKINGKYYSFNLKTKKRVSMFIKSLDIAFGYATPDMLRSMLVENITNELYLTPNQSLIHSEIERVMGDGLGLLAGNNLKKLNSLFDTLKTKSKIFELKDLNELNSYVIFQGIVNYIDNFKDTVRRWDCENLNIRQCSKELLLLNIESFFDKDRNKILELMNMGKIFSKGISNINQNEEIMYGSATAESTFTSSRDLYKLIPTMLPALNTIEEIKLGIYKEPVTVSYEDAYANFWK